MHYTISYKGLRGKAKADRACRDAQSYLGATRYHQVMTVLRDQCRTMTRSRKHIRILMGGLSMFCGISGYPARAMVFRALRQTR